MSPRAARWAIATILALHAVMIAAWTPHIPLVKERLDLSAGELGVAMLGAPVGSVLAILATGPIMSSWGSRRVVLIGGIGSALTAPLVPLASNGPALLAALLVWGFFGGGQGVGMNSQTVTVERAYRRPVIGALQACWNAGALAGTGIGILTVHTGVDLLVQQLVLGAIAMACLLPLCRPLLPDRSASRPAARARSAVFDRQLVPYGLIALFSLLSEGASFDWAAVYLHEEVGASPTLAGSGYAAFSAVMIVGRYASDRLAQRFGGARLVRVLMASSGTVFAAALLVGQPAAGIIGFTALGAGLSVVLPQAFRAASSAAGRHSGEAIAAVSTYGWSGLMAGPPLIGLIAEFTTLTVALGTVCAAILVISALAGRLDARPAPAPIPAPPPGPLDPIPNPSADPIPAPPLDPIPAPSVGPIGGPIAGPPGG